MGLSFVGHTKVKLIRLLFYQKFEDAKIISQIVGFSKDCHKMVTECLQTMKVAIFALGD